MTKKYMAVWYNNKALCPQCRVQPQNIKDYGTDKKGYWFKGICPHCKAIIKWYKNMDLSILDKDQAEGEQLSFFVSQESKKKSSKLSVQKNR